MRKRKLIGLMLLVVGTVASAQVFDPSAIPKIIPPTPNAASLEKFSAIPVDYSTGVPSISYPIWSWQRGKLQFSTALSYHAGGHKVDDMASNTGLGWSMTGIGRISRTVRGIADDDCIKGFMYTDPLPNLITSSYDGQQYYYPSPTTGVQAAVSPYTAITPQNSGSFQTVVDINNSQLDGEQDVFSYSFTGGSGKFIIDKDKNIIPIEHTNTKIEMVCNSMSYPLNGSSGRIVSFKITDDKGIVYKFDYQESQSSVTYSDPEPIPPIPNQDCVSGWLLTKIIDPSTQDSIVINYAVTGSGGAYYETGFSETISNVVGNNGIGPDNASRSFQVIGANDISVSSIIFPDSSLMSFQYEFGRDDLKYSNALTKIKVKNYRDEIIKWFQFRYSYFESGDGDAFPAWEVTDNDFSKRLRLDSLIELSSDSSLSKPTVYTYNATLLNARGSRNIDFWGYNVNPGRNNFQYIPLIVTPPDLWGMYLPGVDRKPDSVYVKAALLEKIKYPTGGFTSFEYEANKAFSSINYFEDKLESNTPEWDQGSFGETYGLSMPGRLDTAVQFFFIAEADPEGTAQSNDPPTCFEEGQNDKIVRFEINSTDDAFSTYREYTYVQLIGGMGITEVIGLPLNKSYEVTVIYDAGAACAFLYPFKVSVQGTYFIGQQDKLAGGARIKKITADDGAGNILSKSYEYNDTTGHSSAVFTSITNIPNYGYYRTGVDETISAPNSYSNHINRSSHPTNTMNFNGAPLVYTRVIEKESDSSYTERQYDPLVWNYNGGDATEYPYSPIQDFPNLSGMMTKEIIKDGDGTTKKLDSITYNKVETHLSGSGNRNLKTGMIASAANYPAQYYVVDQYYMFTTRAEMIKDSTVIYEKDNTLSQVQTRTYDGGNYYLRTSTTTNSKSEDITEAYTYSADGGNATYTAMIGKNMLNYLTQKTIYKPNVANSELSLSQTNYGLWQSGALPVPATIKGSLSGNSPTTIVTFNDYDDKGNILQYTAKDGVLNTFVWGYKKQYPIAKIVGKSYSDAISQSGIYLNIVDRPSSDAAMRTELNKLRDLSGCMVTTFAYKPLAGVTSETDPNGKTTYYIYDNFNRLTLIRDKDSNIIKKFCYNYQGQPVDCGYGSNPAWTAIGSACAIDGSGNFNGNKVITEKDLNPSSSGYGNTRTITMTNDANCVCSGPDKKVISGVCETGMKVCTGNFKIALVWYHYYHYLWSDSSTSGTYTGDGKCGF